MSVGLVIPLLALGGFAYAASRPKTAVPANHIPRVSLGDSPLTGDPMGGLASIGGAASPAGEDGQSETGTESPYGANDNGAAPGENPPSDPNQGTGHHGAQHGYTPPPPAKPKIDIRHVSVLGFSQGTDAGGTTQQTDQAFKTVGPVTGLVW